MAYSKIILNGETLMDVTSDTVDAENLLSGKTATKNSGAKVTGNIASKSSSDLTVSGATITAPSGYYSASASKSIASGTAGTPTATKGTVSNHSVSVTPSVTNTTGYITGSTKTGTAVSVSASELVSGTYTVDSSGTKDVTNYASASISALTLPSTLTNSVTGTMVATLNLPNGVNKYLQIPKGYNNTNSYYQFEVPTGTAGTPTASKGTVSNHAVTVTPSVTNITGYITGGTLTGTGVSVSASELVSGTKSITSNGTGIDVTDYASIDVSVTPSFTATLTSSGASANVYVKHNNTKYYTSGDTFSFSAGDTLVIVCMKGDSNYFNLNGATVAGGYGKDVDNYNWTMPPGNISIALTAQNGSSHVDITANGIPTLITKSITQNGTYDAEDDNADGYSSVTVSVSGGSGLAYETGTFTPDTDIDKPTIEFTNTHSSTPLYIHIIDDGQTVADVDSTLFWVFINWNAYSNASIKSNASTNAYGRAQYGYKTSSALGTGGYTITSLTGTTSTSQLGYYATSSQFTPQAGSTHYFRSTRSYKWIAVWAPTT